jgi:hypothetical protein
MDNKGLTVRQEVSPATVEAIEAWCASSTDADSDSALRSMKNKGKRILGVLARALKKVQSNGIPRGTTPGCDS